MARLIIYKGFEITQEVTARAIIMRAYFRGDLHKKQTYLFYTPRDAENAFINSFNTCEYCGENIELETDAAGELGPHICTEMIINNNF